MTTSTTVVGIKTGRSPTLLRNALLANAVFAGVNGIADMFFSGPMAAFAGVPAAILPFSGAGLLAFAAALLWLRSRPTMSPGLVRTVIALDLVWVIGSVAALLLHDSLGLTVGGAWLVAVGADVVAVFALLQYVGLRGSLRESVRNENA
jgi:hypothetical protein